MSGRMRIRPSKFQSLVGMIAGGVFVVIGLSMPRMTGTFGVIWTLMAFAIGGMHTYNFFSSRGVASWEIDQDLNSLETNRKDDFEARLRKLNSLKEDGLISQTEFEEKRTAIMKSEW